MTTEQKQQWNDVTAEIERLRQQWNASQDHEERVKISAQMNALEKERGWIGM